MKHFKTLLVALAILARCLFEANILPMDLAPESAHQSYEKQPKTVAGPPGGSGDYYRTRSGAKTGLPMDLAPESAHQFYEKQPKTVAGPPGGSGDYYRTRSGGNIRFPMHSDQSSQHFHARQVIAGPPGSGDYH